MKKRYYHYLIPFLLLTASVNAQVAGWTALTGAGTTDLRGIAITSTNTCYLAGYGGKLFKTIDGGSTWNTLISGVTNDLYSIYFTSNTTGYVVGDAGKALKTTDGGATWIQMPVGVTYSFRHVDFISSTTGFIFGGLSGTSGGILKTTDGGSTWTALTVGSTTIYSSTFISATTGFCSNYNGVVFKTNNAGVSWTALTSVTTNPLVAMVSPATNNSFAVGRLGTILNTVDGGAVWTQVAPGMTTNTLAAIDFYDANHGFIAGGSLTSPFPPSIFATTDGGVTWSSSSIPAGSRLNMLKMYSANVGYAVGINGTIFKYTSDVGITEQSKTQAAFPVSPNPFSVSTIIDCHSWEFRNKATIEIYDITGKIVRTADSENRTNFVIDRNELQNGTYLYVIFDGNQKIASGKLLIE